MGRYQHIALVYESPDCYPITPAHHAYPRYQSACAQARKINQELIAQQIHANLEKGWFRIPLDLKPGLIHREADEFGCFRQAAMQAVHQLSANQLDVWAVVDGSSVKEVRPSQPHKAMQELEYQVWKHHHRYQLQQLGGTLLSGRLVIEESGLWIAPQPPTHETPG